MKMTLFKAPASTPGADLEDWGPVGLPLGQPVAHLRGRKMAGSADDRIESGVWECSPGIWRRQVTKAEFCHFIAGRCSFTHEDGTKIEIAAGDSVFFPAESRGVWDVKETVRKVYLVFLP
jgi:uncharacterized protein